MNKVNWSELFGDEFEYIKKLGAALHDPEAKREFWETIKKKKLENPAWSIYEDFPLNLTGKDKARHDCITFVKSLRRAKPEGESEDAMGPQEE